MISTSGAGPKPCFVNKVLLEHSRVQLVYILPVAATETPWPVKPQIIRNWSFSKYVCWSLLYLKLSMLQAVLKIRSKYTLMKGILFPRQRAERNFCRLPQQGDNVENSFLNSVLDRFPLIPRAAAADGQYLYTCLLKEFSGRRTQHNVGTKRLTPLAKSKDKIQMDQRKEQWLFTARTYRILALCQALFYVPHMNKHVYPHRNPIQSEHSFLSPFFRGENWNCFIQGQTTYKWLSWDLNPENLTGETTIISKDEHPTSHHLWRSVLSQARERYSLWLSCLPRTGWMGSLGAVQWPDVYP